MNTQEILTNQTNEEVREEKYVVDCETADNEVVENTAEETADNNVVNSETLEEKIEAAVERKINEKLTTFEEKEDEWDYAAMDEDGVINSEGIHEKMKGLATELTYKKMKVNEKIHEICPDFEEKLKKNIQVAVLSFDNKKRKKAYRFIKFLEEINVIESGHAEFLKEIGNSERKIKKAENDSPKAKFTEHNVYAAIDVSMYDMTEDEVRKNFKKQLEQQIPERNRKFVNIDYMVEESIKIWKRSKEEYEAKTK